MKYLCVLLAVCAILAACDRSVPHHQCQQDEPTLVQPNDPQCADLNYVTYMRWFECEEDLDAFYGQRRIISVDETSSGFSAFYCSKAGVP